MQALTYLQRALLVHDLQTLDATEWESCFNKVRKERRSYKCVILHRTGLIECANEIGYYKPGHLIT